MKEKLQKKGGFTLVEMLIVVAIIAILIAVSLPLVSSNLEKAREAVDDANRRSALSLGMTYYLTNQDDEEINGTTGKEMYYSVDQGDNDNEASYQGTLVDKSDGLKPYGKGTKAGDDDSDNTNSIIKVVIQAPTDTNPNAVTATWETVSSGD